MRNKLGDLARLHHVFDAILEIENYLVDTDFKKFMSNSMVRFACIKQLEIIGMRHIFVHEYFGIDDQLVWNIITIDIPKFKNQIITIIDQYPKL